MFKKSLNMFKISEQVVNFIARKLASWSSSGEQTKT